MTPKKEEFIKKARKVHGNKYDYSKVKYINSYTHVTIICKEHGDFNQIPSSHLTGRGCPICSGKLQSNTSEFIKKAKTIHGDKYDYSEVNYTKAREPVNIICKDHGSFFQIPNNHLNGQGCPWCISRNIKDTKEFIRRAKNTHGDKYNYEKSIWNNSKTNVTIICPIHGEFEQSASEHIKGRGCPICGGFVKKTLEEFIQKAKQIHGNKYDYSKTIYINIKKPVEIICKKHGSFFQIASNHLRGTGCPICKSSKGELIINSILTKYRIEFIQEFIIPNQNYRFRYDFYLPKLNVLIEYHGIQHYKPIEFFGGESSFHDIKLRDSLKKCLAKECRFNFLEINYLHYINSTEEEFEKKLIQLLNKYK